MCQDLSRRTGSSGEPSHHLCTGHTEPVLALVHPSLDARRQLRQGRFEVDDVQGADAAGQAAKIAQSFFIATARCLFLHAIGYAKRSARASRSPRRELRARQACKIFGKNFSLEGPWKSLCFPKLFLHGLMRWSDCSRDAFRTVRGR